MILLANYDVMCPFMECMFDIALDMMSSGILDNVVSSAAMSCV